MELNEFRRNTKVLISNELVSFFVESFVNSDMPFFNEQTTLMNCVVFDKNSQGKIDKTANDNFLNELMLNMCFDRFEGKDNYLALPDDKRIKYAKDIYDLNLETINKKSTVCYDASGFVYNDDSEEMEHEFIIKVLPEDFISSIKYLYNEMRKQGLKDFRMVTPSTKFVCSGYNAPIKLKCRTEDLNLMIDFLNGLDKKFVALTKPVLPVYDIAGSSWYGYEQVHNYRTSTAALGGAVIDAIDDVVNAIIESTDLTMEDGQLAKDYFKQTRNKYVAIKMILRVALKQDHDKTMNDIFEATKSRLFSWNINMADCLRFDSVNRKVEEIYGKELNVDKLIDERIAERMEIKTPVSIVENYGFPISEEEERLNNLLDESEKAFEQARYNAEHGIESKSFMEEMEHLVPTYMGDDPEYVKKMKKLELEEIVSNGVGSISNFRTEDDMNAALAMAGVKEFMAKDTSIVNKYYASHLTESLIKYTNSSTPEEKEEVSNYNEALQEYQNMVYDDLLSQSPDMPEEIKDAGKANVDSSEINSVTNGIDIAIAAIEASEEMELQKKKFKEEHPDLFEHNQDIDKNEDEEKEFKPLTFNVYTIGDDSKVKEKTERTLEDLDIIDISKKAVPNYNKEKTVIIGATKEEIPEINDEKPEIVEKPEQDIVSNFASGKTEVLTDVVSEVVSQIKQEEAVQPEVKDVDNDAIHNPYGLEYINPESHCHDYMNNEGILIPDLSDAFYKGEKLSDALKAGGYEPGFDYVKAVAKHFGIDYTGTKEEQKNLLWILRNLDKFYFDGTMREEYQEGKKENVNKSVSKAPVKDMSMINPRPADLPIEHNKSFIDSYKWRYSDYVKDGSLLDLYVKGTDYTVLDYFLYYDISKRFKYNSRIILHEEGKEITGSEFAKDYLIVYLVTYGAEDLENIINYYVEEILPPQRRVTR